ncbi:DnaA N-terminal domain-containing protein [Candidatus Latescibacterota bacterium]
MGKQPAFQFYPKDWIVDTSSLSLAAKGAWIDLLSAMWFSSTRGKLTKDWIGYSRLIRATVDQTKAVISELIDMGICDMENGDDKITIMSRRMMREEKEREKTRKRQQKFQRKAKAEQIGTQEDNEDKRKYNGYMTPPSSSSSPSPNNTHQRAREELVLKYGEKNVAKYERRFERYTKRSGRKYSDQYATMEDWMTDDDIAIVQLPSKSITESIPQYDIEAYRKVLLEEKGDLQSWFRENILARIRDEINDQSYKTWFEPLLAISVTGDTILIHAPAQYFENWLIEHYGQLIKRVLENIRKTEKNDSNRAKLPTKYKVTAAVPEKYIIEEEIYTG